MTEEQRQAALEALDRLEPDAKNYREEYPTQCESADGDAMIVRAALKQQQVPVIEDLDDEVLRFLLEQVSLIQKKAKE